MVKQIEKFTPGYVGKAKGALQIAFKRGFCDEKMEKNGVKVSAHGKETDKYNNKYTAKQMTVQEIKEKLSQLNLPCNGRKEDLMRVCTDNNLPTTKKVRNRKRDISTSVYHFLVIVRTSKTKRVKCNTYSRISLGSHCV